jgi:hypothetical protein
MIEYFYLGGFRDTNEPREIAMPVPAETLGDISGCRPCRIFDLPVQFEVFGTKDSCT